MSEIPSATLAYVGDPITAPRHRLWMAILIGILLGLAVPGTASALSGNQRLVVVLCKFSDQTNEPHTSQYYQDMFSETGAGKHGVFDFWRDVSYGNLDLTGTVVKGWYTAPMTAAQFNVAARNVQIDTCASQAVNDVNFNNFAGVYVLTNHTNLQGPLFGGGPPTKINGTTYNALGQAAAEEDAALNGIVHESGHSLRVQHSRAMSNNPAAQTDYGDFYDVMSCLGCAGNSSFSYQGQGGPGLNVVQVDTSGWLPGNRALAFNNTACAQQTIQLAALNHPEAAGFLEVRMPAAVPIVDGATTGDYYTVELRDKSGWDSGITQNGVLIHLHGLDAYSYWVDQSGAWGTYSGSAPLMLPGSEYVDAATQNVYVAVNSVDPAAHTAIVTLGACKIDASLTYTGDTEGDFNDSITLAGDLVVKGTSAPVPNAIVKFVIGTESCFGTTNASGHAVCPTVLNQHPRSYTIAASYAGDPAYNTTSASVGFTITKEESRLTYGGALTEDYHDPFTASATLVDPVGGVPIAGKTIVFTLGVGDTCSAVTSASGFASCSITPTQAAGSYPLVASFAGDVDYVASSDTKTFVITREETTTAYTGPTVILEGAPVTLTGLLLEDGTTPIQGRTLTLSLGAQSCTGTTNANGVASCSLSVTVTLGSQQLTADFAGDAFYLPSTDATKTAIVFAFPERGAFVLGDQTVAGATPSTVVTWWSDVWSKVNDLSSDRVNLAFKGFAGTVSSNPPTCGGSWTTTTGNSPPPTGTVPTYMGVLVTRAVGKSGSKFSGRTAKIVVVLTRPGYAPDPASPGTGTIVATYCQ
jgi:M6 family metalloprotease-like protein